MKKRLSAMSRHLSCYSLSGCRAFDATQCCRRVEHRLLPYRSRKLQKSELKAELRLARLQRSHSVVEVGTWLSPRFLDDTLRQRRCAGAPMALSRGGERLPRKYVCGVAPSIVRNISMNALT